MTPYDWRQMLTAAVYNHDDTMLTCLVAHLMACERAGVMLHAHGCRPGQPTDLMVRQVLHHPPPEGRLSDSKN